MIDYAGIQPMMSLSTFVVGIIVALLIARAAIELIDKKKSPRDVGRRPAGLRRLSPSQKAIQRYYNQNQYENKGA